MLKFSLRFRLLTFLIIGALVALGIFGIYRTGMIFLPETDERFFSANIDMTSGTNLETTEEALDEMEAYLLGIEEIDVFLAMAGASETSGVGGGGEASQGSIYVTTVPPDERERSTNEVANEVGKELQTIAESHVDDAEVSMMTTTSTGTDSSVLTFNLMNSSEQDLEEDEEKVTEALGEMDSVTRVSNNTTDTIDELAITLDHDELFENGLSASEVAGTFNNLTTGMDVVMVLDEDTEEYLMVRMTLPDEDVDSEEAIADMVISRTEEGAVTLDEVAVVDRQPAPSAVERINGQHAYQYELELEPGASLSEA